MTYPDGNTATTITGTAEDASGNVRLTWKELTYIREGRRRIDFNGSYAATITDDTMDGAWYQADRRVARFTMTTSDRSATPAFPG
jgi:sRNA-binding protein